MDSFLDEVDGRLNKVEEEKDEEMGDTSILYPAATIKHDDVMFAASVASESSLLDDSKHEKANFVTFGTVADVEDDEEPPCPDTEEPSTTSLPYRNSSIYSTNSSTATPIISNVKSRTKRWTQQSKVVAPTPTSSGTRSFADSNLVSMENKNTNASDIEVRRKGVSKRWCWILTGTLFLVAAAMLGGYCGVTGRCAPRRDTDINGGGTDGNNNTNMFIEDIINNNISLSEDNITPEDATAEGAALQWLIDEDTFDYDYSGIQFGTNQTSTFRLRQRYALALLLLQQSQGIPTSVLSNECDWPGVVCKPTALGNAVVALNMSNGSLVRIPLDDGLLEHLESFSVSHNPSLNGTLPETIGRWSNLEIFDSSSTSLSGSLPKSIGDWSNLRKFHIDATHPADLPTLFSGSDPIPKGFSGTLPRSIGNWKEIQEVRMYGNSFTGTLPSSLESWTDLTLVSVCVSKVLHRCGAYMAITNRFSSPPCDHLLLGY